MLEKRHLHQEITRALEAGVNTQLNRSIAYSPLKFFYNRYKKNNPQTIIQVRQIVAQDIENILNNIDNFKIKDFIVGGKPAILGQMILQRNYNIGISLLKKHLTVVKAFRIITKPYDREQFYEFVLRLVKQSVIKIIREQIEER